MARDQLGGSVSTSWLRDSRHQAEDPAFVMPFEEQINDQHTIDLDSEVAILVEAQLTISEELDRGRNFDAKPDWFIRLCVEQYQRIVERGRAAQQARLFLSTPELIKERPSAAMP